MSDGSTAAEICPRTERSFLGEECFLYQYVLFGQEERVGRTSAKFRLSLLEDIGQAVFLYDLATI